MPDDTLAKPVEEIDARLRPTFCMICAGSSRSGKTTYVKQLLADPDLWSNYPDSVLLCYQSSSPEQYADWTAACDIQLYKGVPTQVPGDGHRLVILDDLTPDYIDQYLNTLIDLFCVRSSHDRLSCIAVVHNLYYKNLRSLRLSASYLVFFPSLLDCSHLTRFAHQAFADRPHIFLDTYKQAMQDRAYAHLMYDANPSTNPRHRLRSRVTDIPQEVFIPEDDETPAPKRRRAT